MCVNIVFSEPLAKKVRNRKKVKIFKNTFQDTVPLLTQ